MAEETFIETELAKLAARVTTLEGKHGCEDHLVAHPSIAEHAIAPVRETLEYQKSSGIDGDAGDWTESGQDVNGFPVPKGSPEDVTVERETSMATGLPVD